MDHLKVECIERIKEIDDKCSQLLAKSQRGLSRHPCFCGLSKQDSDVVAAIFKKERQENIPGTEADRFNRNIIELSKKYLKRSSILLK
jgi:hypothetical protein